MFSFTCLPQQVKNENRYYVQTVYLLTGMSPVHQVALRFYNEQKGKSIFCYHSTDESVCLDKSGGRSAHNGLMTGRGGLKVGFLYNAANGYCMSGFSSKHLSNRSFGPTFTTDHMLSHKHLSHLNLTASQLLSFQR